MAMELQNVRTTTTWNDAAERINRNNLKIGTEITKLQNATYKNKGYFKTLHDLQSAHSTTSSGSIAWVGITYPFTLYFWDGSAWVTDGTTGGDESLDLSQYYTKEEVNEAIANSIEFLPQSVYDALEVKEDKWYATYDG